MNLSKYKLATGDEKNIHKSAILSNLESRSLYLNDSDLTKQQINDGKLYVRFSCVPKDIVES